MENQKVHRFRWLWNFVCIPISLGLVIFALSTQSNLKTATEKADANVEHYKYQLNTYKEKLKELQSVSNSDLLVENYEKTNSALTAAVGRVISLQKQLNETTQQADSDEKTAKLKELTTEQSKLFANGFINKSIFVLNTEWTVEVVNTTPFAVSEIPVVFTMYNSNHEFMGAAYGTYYVSTDTFSLYRVVYSNAGLESQKNTQAVSDSVQQQYNEDWGD